MLIINNEHYYWGVEETFELYDRRGVRAFVRYAPNSGTWAIECFRKKTKEESEGDHDWKMIRVGHIQTYNTRNEANIKALELADSICKEFNFKKS